jgi:hypothetical protein
MPTLTRISLEETLQNLKLHQQSFGDPHKPCIAGLKGKIAETEMRWEADITLDRTYALPSNNGF